MNPQEVKHISQRANDKSARHGQSHPPLTSGKADPADHAGGDRVQEIGFTLDGVDGVQLRAEQNACDGSTKPRKRVDEKFQSVGVDSFLPHDRESKMFPGNKYGRTLHFGIREHGMGAIMNGIALHGGTRVYGGTFLTFSDYMRGAVRLAALMQLPVTYVWTHDSIGLGEDGPTHQPIEHLWALRAIPHLAVVRPGDANETVAAWKHILEQPTNPSALALSRQNLPVVDRSNGLASADGTAKGGYVLAEADGDPQVILIATGSEVQIALAAREQLQASGNPTRVVSMPCVEWFEEQDSAYREQVLPHRIKARVSIEAGVTFGWRQFVGDSGASIGVDHFGASADYQRLYEEFGLTAERVVATARTVLDQIGAASE